MPNLNDKELAELRIKIDQIDRKILNLIEERFEIVNDIAKIKREKGLPIRDLKREEEVIKSKYGLTELPEEFVSKLFRLIIDESARQEEES